MLNGLGHLRLIAGRVDGEALLLAHEHGQVERETVRVVHTERIVARQHRRASELLAPLIKLNDALLERAREDLLLLAQDGLDALGIFGELGEGAAHARHQRVHQLRKEALGHIELLGAVAHRAAQDAAEHVAATLR